MREIVFDTETTGLDPRTGDRITELVAAQETQMGTRAALEKLSTIEVKA